MSSQINNTFITAPTSPNPYITRKLNNIEEARIMKEERNDWMKIYHKTLKGNDRYTKASKGHDEDSGRSQHNDDGDRRLNSKSQQQQPGHNHNKHYRGVRRSKISNLK